MTTDGLLNKKNGQDEIQQCPEIAPEGKIGVTSKEREWAAIKPPRPRVPRYVFTTALVCLTLVLTTSAAWYYRKNILPEKYYMKAAAMFEAEQYQTALELYKKVIEIQPARRDIYNYMARAMVRTGKSELAAAYYETHLQKQPDDNIAKWEAGELYAEMKNYGRALALMESVRGADSAQMERMAAIFLLVGDTKKAADSLRDAALAGSDAEKTLGIAKELIKLGFYEHALEAFTRTGQLAPEDKRGLHGANAAKAMLGRPTDPAMTIAPGKFLGPVNLGADKNSVKEAMGAPEEKAFTKIDRFDVELWHYGKKSKKRSMTLFFVDNRIKEIETRYREFKTEDGLSVDNFMLEKRSGNIEKRVALDDGRTRFDVKGGGMTFYASGINETGDGAKYAKLIIHRKGEKPIGESQSSWLRLSW